MDVLKLFLMSKSVIQVPGLTIADCVILDQRRALGVSLVQSPVGSVSTWCLWLYLPKGIRTIARRNVVHDWTCVANRPCAPHKFYGISSVDVGVKTARCGTLVAVDVCGSGIRRFNKANVLIESVPAGSLRTGILGVVVPYRVRAIGECALDIDTLDETVGGCRVK